MRNAADSDVSPSLEENSTIGGRFRMRRLLKRGQGVETWLATDLVENTDRVVKTAATAAVPRSVRQRLEHEALVLQQLHSPYLGQLIQSGSDEDLLYLCLPFVPGATLAQRLREGPLSPRNTLTIGLCVLEALQEAHARAVLHRDIKPANIIVDEAGSVTKAVLIDFGLARSTQLEASIRDLPVGTVRYLAPEQAGLLERGVDARSDLYAVGAVLFECLAGRPPFEGDTAGEVLRQHLAFPVPELRSLGVVVPRVLDEVVQRLLCKDPRDRYQSAGAALADLTAIGAALDRGQVEPALVIGASDRRATLTDPAFIGRVEDMDTVVTALEEARQGAGGLVLLEAPSGGGKTWLFNELARRGLAHGAWMLRGRGVDQTAQRPFQVFAGVVEGLLAAAQSDPATARAIRQRLGDQREIAAAVLPDLAPLLEVRAGASLGPEAFAEARCLPTLARLVDALGTPDRPAAVLLDDCQWADDLTLKLLGYWHTRHGLENPEARHTLVVAAFRSEEVSSDHPLRRLQPSVHVTLSPFSETEVADLVHSMAGQVPTEAVRVVTRLAEGSPFMAAAVLRGLVESGALVPGEAGWNVEPPALADVQSSRHAAALLARRLGLLPPPVLQVLSVAAVLGKEFDLDLVSTLAGQSRPAPNQAVMMLEEARRRHIVWADKQGARWVFVHDKLREALLHRLPPEERKAFHARAAEQLERLDPDRVFELAYHFDATGARGRALPYALAAAEKARAQQSLAIAERQYRIAKRGAGQAEAAVRRRVAEGLGETLMLRGGYEEAGAQLEAARALAEDDTARAQLDGKLGELAFKQGEVCKASQALERALRLLGRWVPRTTLGLLAALTWEVVVQILHTLFPILFLNRRKLDGAEGERLAMRLYGRLAYAYWFFRGKLPCLWAHLREMNLAERYPPTPELAQAYSEHAPVMTMIPYFRRGVEYVEKSLAFRRAFGDVWGQGQSLNFYGVVLYSSSRYRECIEKCQETIRLLERTGDRWEANTAAWHIAFCHYRLGELREAIEVSQRAYQAGKDIGDRHAMAISLGAWAKASGGRAPENLLRAELEHAAEDLHTRAELSQAEAIRLLGIFQPAQAVAILEHSRRLTAGLRQEYVVPIWPWLATALRCELEDLPVWDVRGRRRRLGYAQWVARRAVALAYRYPNNLPHALREAALLAAMAGHTRQARKFFRESLAVAERQGAQAEKAQTLAARGEVGLALGWPDAAAEATSGRVMMARLVSETEPADTPIAPSFTLSLADRFEALLDAGRHIASALSPEAIHAAVREAARRLLRAEQCMTLTVTADTPSVEVAHFIALGEQPEAAYSVTLARQCLAEGRPILFTEGLSGDPSESMALSGVRSALYAPISVRGRATACFVATHRHVGQLFGETEERLAAFIAALAGAALENAEGFTQVETLSQARQQLLAREQAARAELEGLVKRLQQAEAELRQAGQAKDQFLAMLAHELRNPLQPIRHALHIQGMPRVTPAALERARTMIERQVDHMVRLVDDLLDATRIARGKIQLQLERLDFSQLVRVTAGDRRPMLEQVGLHLRVDVPNFPVWIRGDPARLVQVVNNLLDNSAKFTDRGGEVAIQLTEAVEVREAILRVRDTGIGIEPDMLPRVFDVFAQADRSLDRSRGGLGLGLAVVKGLIELHQGTVQVFSEGPGRGTEFVIRLGMEEPALSPPAGDAASLAAAEPQRILVVEDSEDAAESLRLLLTILGHEVRVAGTGHAGLALATEWQPDVVLSDIGLPGLDGFALARELRRNPMTQNMRLIAITGYGSDFDSALYRSSGFERVLTKPADPAVVEQLLNRRLPR